jgi:arsenate reductase
MAAAWFRSFHPGLEVYSAGTQPGTVVNPFAIRVMEEVGLTLAGMVPTSVLPYLGEDLDLVLTICKNAAVICPPFTGKVGHQLCIPFPDPWLATGSEDEVLAVYRASRDDLREGLFQVYQQFCLPI